MARKKRKKKLKLIHIVLSFLFIYVATIFFNQSRMLKELEAKKQENISEINQLKMEIEDLTQQVENSETLEFVEKIAREDFGMVKPREIIYIDKNKEKTSPFKDE